VFIYSHAVYHIGETMLGKLKRKLKDAYEGRLEGFTSIAYLLIGLAIIGGVGILVTAEFNASTTNTAVHTFLGDVAGAYETLGDFLGIVVIALIGLMLISYFQGRG